MGMGNPTGVGLPKLGLLPKLEPFYETVQNLMFLWLFSIMVKIKHVLIAECVFKYGKICSLSEIFLKKNKNVNLLQLEEWSGRVDSTVENRYKVRSSCRNKWRNKVKHRKQTKLCGDYLKPKISVSRNELRKKLVKNGNSKTRCTVGNIVDKVQQSDLDTF